MSQGLRSAPSAALQMAGSIRLVKHITQQVNDIGFLVVENLGVDILSGAASIDASIRLFTQDNQKIYPIKFSSVAMTSTEHDDGAAAQVDKMV